MAKSVKKKRKVKVESTGQASYSGLPLTILLSHLQIIVDK